MSEPIETSVDALRAKGYNCAQVVAQLCLQNRGAVSPDILRSFRSFGGGLNCGRVCGCVLGAAAAFGFFAPETLEGKTACRAATKQLVQQFEEKFGSSECSVLKTQKDGRPPVPCPTLMAETFNLWLPIAARHGI